MVAARGSRACEACGTNISHLHGSAKWCSPQCRYTSRGHTPRRMTVTHEERLAARRARRAAMQPATRACECRECGSTFHVANSPGRRPQRCGSCREIKKSLTRQRTGRQCRRCEALIPAGRRIDAVYCSTSCQQLSNNVRFMALRKQARATVRQGRECAICGADISGRNGNSRYCGGACWRAVNFPTADMSRAVCASCGASLAGRKGGTEYCDWQCRHKALYVTVPRKSYEKICDWCGGVFTAVHARAQYCSGSCNQQAFIDRDRDAYRARKREENCVRRAREAGTPTYRITERDWRRLLERYRASCAYCGVRSDNLTRDHVVPIARGGPHGIGNLLPACARCNGSKNDRFITEWRIGRTVRFARPRAGGL
jgi:hypothetical protein